MKLDRTVPKDDLQLQPVTSSENMKTDLSSTQNTHTIGQLSQYRDSNYVDEHMESVENTLYEDTRTVLKCGQGNYSPSTSLYESLADTHLEYQGDTVVIDTPHRDGNIEEVKQDSNCLYTEIGPFGSQKMKAVSCTSIPLATSAAGSSEKPTQRIVVCKGLLLVIITTFHIFTQGRCVDGLFVSILRGESSYM